MKGYSYPGKSPLRDDPSQSELDERVSGENQAEEGWLQKTANNGFVKEVAVGTLVGALSKPKKEFKPVRITGSEEEKIA